MLDIFQGDAFNLVSLTTAMEILPYLPSRLGELGIFQEEGISSTTVVVENRDGTLSLVPSAPRGSMPEYGKKDLRKVRNFLVPHHPKNDSILAEEVQNLRSFGSEDQTEAVSSVLNRKLENLKADFEATFEWQRACALRGLVVDADGSTTLYNLFTEFGISETNINFPMSVAGSVTTACRTLVRTVKLALGSLTYKGIRVLCSTTFFDALIASVDVKAAYDKYQEGSFFQQPQAGGFKFQDIIFEEYINSMGGTPFIPAGTARVVVEGAPGLYKRANAPADFIETVNTIGKPYYVKQEPMPFGKGILIHAQANPFHYCARPSVLIKATAT